MSSTPEPSIGLLSWDYGRPKGGMGRSLQQIVAALRTMNGAERSAVRPHEPDEFRRRRSPLGSNGSALEAEQTIHVLAPCPGDAPDNSFLSLTKRFGGQMLFSALLPFTLKRRIRSNMIRSLIVPVGPGGVLLFRRPSVPAIAIVYHSYLQQYQLVPGQWWKRIFCPFERRTLSLCRRILCYSNDTRRALIEGYRIDPHTITVLPHAVAIPETSSVERDPFLCLCVARLEMRKGVGVLLHAWPYIHSQIPQARLLIIGDGVQRRTIDRMIAGLPHVERRAGVSQQELDDLLARAGIAFCPAYLEGFGLACAEAMAAGCCVIASDADGLRQLIDQGRSGILVPAGDSEALAAATIGVFSNPALSHSIGAQAIASIRLHHDPVAADRALCDAVRSAFA